MNFTLETGISAFTVLIQGLLSFFSPCVLPLLPLYISYLSGGTKTVDEDGAIRYKQSKVMRNTFFFVIGISFAFFLLGLGFTAIGSFFKEYQVWFTRIGGIIIVLFGANQLGLFGSLSFGKEHRFHFSPDRLSMNPLTALVLGFTFSFAWTPCVGPALTSVLIMAASAASSTAGFGLIGIYTLGFVVPFLAVGLFTGTLLELFKKHRKVVKYTVKTGGVLMIIIGIMMFTGWMNTFSSYLNSGTSSGLSEENMKEPSASSVPETYSEADSESSSTAADTPVSPPAPDFTLTDQFGNTHTLSDYKGKTVFLNFWATWCPPCVAEMPEIQELYEDYGNNESDIIILGIASPDYGREGSVEQVTAFLEENEYSYPVVMDHEGTMAYSYGVNAYPTTFMIDADGNVYGYVSGQLTKDIMINIIEQTIAASTP